MKIVINKCYGGFSLSPEAISLYKKRKNITDPDWWVRDIERDCPILVEIVQELQSRADGDFAKLKIVEIPDDVKLKIVEIPDDVEWSLEEHDGIEWIAEVHRTWS